MCLFLCSLINVFDIKFYAGVFSEFPPLESDFDWRLSLPNSPFDGQLNGRASLMTDHPKKVIYDFYFQTADAKSPIASVKIKASISERPLNAGTTYIGVSELRARVINW